MLHTRLVSAFVKAGCEVKSLRWDENDMTPCRRWVVKNPKNGRSMEWHTQDLFVPSKGGVEAHYDHSRQYVSSVCARHPDTDAMTDLFMDSFYHTVKGAVEAITRS